MPRYISCTALFNEFVRIVIVRIRDMLLIRFKMIIKTAGLLSLSVLRMMEISLDRHTWPALKGHNME